MTNSPITALSGVVGFKVAGQKADPKWKQTMLKEMIKLGTAPTEALRFQCRIATDARENFEKIELADGETLTLHPKARPQFGKNRDGKAFLTATMIYSGDGKSYRLSWVGESVPRKMQEVAVKHDQGLAVRAATIPLDLANAKVTLSAQAHRNVGAPSRTPEALRDHQRAIRSGKHVPKKRGPRTCSRLTDEDLLAHA